MNCGQCLVERAEMVALKPDGTCPDCGADSSAGRKPRKRTYCESCGDETHPGDLRPWACSSACYADIVRITHPDY